MKNRTSQLPVDMTSLMSRRQLLVRAAAAGALPAMAQLGTVGPASAQSTPAASPASTGRAGPAADKVTFAAYNVDQAPLNIQNGDIDLYIYGLKTVGAQSLEGADGINLLDAPASTLSLILNPAPGADGSLNPFSIPEVRYAMQFLVDRNFIASDIYQGRALPMLTNIAPGDYDQLTIFQILAGANIRHDEEYAKQQIATAMQAAGATLDNNVWSFNGSPIQLKFITRVEDERRDIGDLIRTALEGAGFQVQPVYQQFGPATLAVYASDPKSFQWHLYTEGWGRGAPVRYDDAGINQFAAPWLGNMPGWQEVGFWQYENDTLDDLGKKLYRGEFVSQDDRNQLYQQMVETALQESVRVWLVTALQSFPVRDDVQDLTQDIVSGPRNAFALRSAHIDGRDDLKVGSQWVWTERTTWNPVGGFGDIYSTDIYRNTIDPVLISHPYTGLPQPFRASYTVETAGPDSTLPVPEDAVVWDANTDAWTPVSSGTTAKSKVTFDYSKFFQSTWQHGQPVTMADVIYPIAQGYEIAFDDNKVQIETALGITSRPLLETNKGFRLASPTELEVYVDYWHFEEGYIASYASPSGVSTPWEVLFALDDVVFEKRQGAYSDTSAARFSVPWLSLVTERDIRLVLRSLKQFKREKATPEAAFNFGDGPLVKEDEAAARYDACQEWFDNTNLLVISNGPFQLTRYDPPAQFAQLDAFRPEGYPFTVDDFRFGPVPTITVEPVTAPAIALGEPISLQVTVDGPGTLAMQYALVDSAQGTVVANGEGTAGDAGVFSIDVDPAVSATLFPGLYQLRLLASSTDIAAVDQQEVDLEIGL